MPLNLEIKVKLKNHTDTEKILKKIKAKKVKVFGQKDVYYKRKDDLLKLRIEAAGFSLIKYLRDEKGKDRWSDYEILNLTGNDPEKYLKSLFDIETTVVKERILYMFDNTRIHLDKVKGLGYFLELETLMIKDKADAKKRFNYLTEELQLDVKNEIKMSYRDLMLKKSKSKN
jgi:Adenylate cyclase, class 2 (thermophilic)